MKLFDKKTLILLISVVSINILCIISVSYAYFTAKIEGNDKAKEMTVHAGTMLITYTDSDEVSLNNALPGDSVTKQFKVENTGTLETKYNIKLIVEENNFIDKQDLEITLKRNNREDVTNIVPVMDEGYILIDEPLELNGIHNYTLTLNFKNDLEDTNQNDNTNKKVKFKIGVDSNSDVELYEYSYSKDDTFYAKLKEAELNGNAVYDDFGNIRYIGAEPNNYIWFNCDDYTKPTEETCEKWQIIGDFKDAEKSDGTKEDLIKIIRAESIGNMPWDNKPEGTGTSESGYGSNNWADSRLMMLLNPGYEDNELMGGLEGSLYWNRKDGNCIASDTNKGVAQNGISIECNLGSKGLKDGKTKEMIEQVKWYLGGIINSDFPASKFYMAERGTENCEILNKCTTSRPATWDGYVGIMYASDYGYAAESSCYSTELYRYDGYSDCYQLDWLYITDTWQWTFTADSDIGYDAYRVIAWGYIGDGWGGPIETLAIRPTLYLKSNIKIADGKGSQEEPYILVP